MPTRITASRLRDDIYNILDRISETGVPVEVVRHGRILEIARKTSPVKPARRGRRKRAMIGDPEDFVHMDWLRYWTESG